MKWFSNSLLNQLYKTKNIHKIDWIKKTFIKFIINSINKYAYYINLIYIKIISDNNKKEHLY